VDFGQLYVDDINRSYDRESFSCGNDELDQYLRRYANSHHRKGLNKTKVLTNDNCQILGFFSLAATCVKRQEFPTSISEKLPSYPIPCILLTQFAIDIRFQGQQLGGFLLKKALCHAYAISQEIGSIAVIVDAINVDAKDFYLHYGFRSLDSDMKLYILEPIAK
jgi:GNAT superfamily N-acetyltransferase